jgi:hypothetical protein
MASALACTSADKFALELGKSTEHCQHQAAMGCRAICPGMFQRAEASTGLGNYIQDVQQVSRGPCQPVQPRNDKRVARFNAAQELRQYRSIRFGSADLLTVDFRASRSFEVCNLASQVLAVLCSPDQSATIRCWFGHALRVSPRALKRSGGSERCSMGDPYMAQRPLEQATLLDLQIGLFQLFCAKIREDREPALAQESSGLTGIEPK